MTWWDEQCPEDIYMEFLARGAACDGHLIGSFTPAGPEGALGITQRFLAEPSPDRKIFYIRSADITHISAERLEQLGAEYGDEWQIHRRRTCACPTTALTKFKAGIQSQMPWQFRLSA
jgi:phage terminase large subunit-like protein